MNLAPILTTCAMLLGISILAAPVDDFSPLVDGNDINQFELIKIDADSMTIQGGQIRLTGKPNGYFATKKRYKNYTIVFDWMYERPEDLKSEAGFGGNSGLLVYVVEPLKIWPKSIEVQLANQDAGNIFAIDGKFDIAKEATAKKGAVKPVGEWNRMEVTCKEGAISCKLNDVLTCQGQGASPSEGRIAWQSEGSPIRFRNIKIKVLD